MNFLLVLEWSAILITALAVLLTAYQRIWCWPASLVSVTLFGWLFFEFRLYADMGLQAVYAGFAIYGWWAWLHGGENDGPLRVTRVPRGQLLMALVLGGIGALTLATLLSLYTDAAVPWADSTLTSFSLVAQWLMTRKHIESWPLWIVLDLFYFWLFLSRGLVGTAFLYGVGFVVLAILGWREWKRALDEPGDLSNASISSAAEAT